MKKCLYLLFPALLLLACSRNYHNQITGDPFPAQQGRQGFLDSATRDSVAKGWVSLTPIAVEYRNASEADTSYSIKRTIVTVKKTPYQNWKDFWATTWRVAGWFIGILLVIGSLVKFVISTSKDDGKTPGDTSKMGWLLVTFVGLVLIGTTTYPWSDQMDVPKAEYDLNQSQFGEQSLLDWDNAKTY